MRKVLKWAGLAVGGVFALALVLGSTAFAVGHSRISATADVQPRVTAAATDSGAVERGRHIARTHGCQDCHGQNFQGQVFLDIPPGLFVASNLTRGKGGVGGTFQDGDWDRAIRYGVRPNGHRLAPMMPYLLFNHLSDADVADLIAYLKSIPPVDNELPPTQIRFVGNLMFASPAFSPKKVAAELTTPYPQAPPAGPTAEYGKYLASSTCIECHGERLSGGHHPDPAGPAVPSLMGYAATDVSVFADALQRGKAPGRQLSEYMPYKYFAEYTDTEVQALHAYIKQLATQNAAGTQAD